jgi:hypothetical protein
MRHDQLLRLHKETIVALNWLAAHVDDPDMSDADLERINLALDKLYVAALSALVRLRKDEQVLQRLDEREQFDDGGVPD